DRRKQQFKDWLSPGVADLQAPRPGLQFPTVHQFESDLTGIFFCLPKVRQLSAVGIDIAAVVSFEVEIIGRHRLSPLAAGRLLHLITTENALQWHMIHELDPTHQKNYLFCSAKSLVLAQLRDQEPPTR